MKHSVTTGTTWTPWKIRMTAGPCPRVRYVTFFSTVTSITDVLVNRLTDLRHSGVFPSASPNLFICSFISVVYWHFTLMIKWRFCTLYKSRNIWLFLPSFRYKLTRNDVREIVDCKFIYFLKRDTYFNWNLVCYCTISLAINQFTLDLHLLRRNLVEFISLFCYSLTNRELKYL